MNINKPSLSGVLLLCRSTWAYLRVKGKKELFIPVFGIFIRLSKASIILTRGFVFLNRILSNIYHYLNRVDFYIISLQFFVLSCRRGFVLNFVRKWFGRYGVSILHNYIY